MRWTINPELQQHCSRKFLGYGFDPDYKYCMKNQLPAADVVTLHSDGKSDIDWDNYQVGKEDPPTTISSYSAGCSGDSGSGQFISNGFEPENEEKFRFILSAIFTKKVGNTFKDDKGEEYKVPCGSYTFNNEASYIGNRNYLQSYAISESITTPVSTLAWIKETAEICKVTKEGEKCIIS